MFSLKNLVLFFTSTLGLLEEKLGSDWFKECISKKSGINRCTEYDFMASVAFLKKINNIAAFSPLCCDYIVLLQCSKIPFDSDDDEKIKKALKYLKNQLEYIVSDKCNIYICSYEKNESPKNHHARYGYMCEVFTGIDSTNIFKKLRYNILNKTDAKQLYQKHVIWLKDASNGYITSPLKIRYPRRFGCIYDSFVFFNDIWAKKFDTCLSEKDFQLSNGLKIPKLFIHKKDYFKYAEVTTTDLKYQVVAIPYQEKKKKYFSRYMVYLIPEQHNDDLLKIWDSFYTFSNGKIRNLILKMNLKEIDLYIPTVSELTSSFNLKDILNDALKYDSDSYSYNRMVTYFNVDENGAEKFDLLSDDFGDSCGEVPLVIADRPYISFVFDIQYERIIFLIKDTGTIQEEEC